jgi:hypothetical protein
VTDQHRIEVRTGGNHTAAAFCTCGWISQQQTSSALAEREGDDHVTYMARIETD